MVKIIVTLPALLAIVQAAPLACLPKHLGNCHPSNDTIPGAGVQPHSGPGALYPVHHLSNHTTSHAGQANRPSYYPYNITVAETQVSSSEAPASPRSMPLHRVNNIIPGAPRTISDAFATVDKAAYHNQSKRTACRFGHLGNCHPFNHTPGESQLRNPSELPASTAAHRFHHSQPMNFTTDHLAPLREPLTSKKSEFLASVVQPRPSHRWDPRNYNRSTNATSDHAAHSKKSLLVEQTEFLASMSPPELPGSSKASARLDAETRERKVKKVTQALFEAREDLPRGHMIESSDHRALPFQDASTASNELPRIQYNENVI